MANQKKQSCFACGQPMRFGIGMDRIEYKGQSREFENEGWWCDGTSGCGESMFVGDALRKSDMELATLKAEVEEVLPPAEIRKIRKALGLSQVLAGERLGGGKAAFQRYESGTIQVSQAMSNLLRLLADDPSLLNKLPKKLA